MSSAVTRITAVIRARMSLLSQGSRLFRTLSPQQSQAAVFVDVIAPFSPSDHIRSNLVRNLMDSGSLSQCPSLVSRVSKCYPASFTCFPQYPRMFSQDFHEQSFLFSIFWGSTSSLSRKSKQTFCSPSRSQWNVLWSTTRTELESCTSAKTSACIASSAVSPGRQYFRPVTSASELLEPCLCVP